MQGRESPECLDTQEDPAYIALMGTRIGVVHEKCIGVWCKTSEDFLTSAAPKIEEAYGREPVVMVLDNARIHRGTR